MAQYYCNLSAGDTVNSILANGGTYDVSISKDIDCQDINCRKVTGTGALIATTATFSGALEGTTGTFTGAITAASASSQVKSFNITHPTKDGKRLWHGCLEGPEHAVYVRGRLTGDDSIILPDYWSGLVHEDTITVQLQAIGVNQDIVVKEWNLEKVVLSSSTPIDCFYTITGTRKDVPLLEVEQDE